MPYYRHKRTKRVVSIVETEATRILVKYESTYSKYPRKSTDTGIRVWYPIAEFFRLFKEI